MYNNRKQNCFNYKLKMKPLIIKFFIFSLLLGIFYSCTVSKHSGTNKITGIVYPQPPDTARIQFLTSFSSSEFATGKQKGFNRLVFGEEAPNNIVKPMGIKVKNGKIYICDNILNCILIFDLEKHEFEYFIPEGKGTLKMPLNCFVDDSGMLYVADAMRGQVVIFDKDGSYINAFGKTKEYKPSDVIVFENKIWVANLAGNTVDVFENSAPYNYLYSIPDSEATNDQKLYQPTNLAIARNEVCVTDFGQFVIKTYSLKGEYLRTVGSYGQGLGQFVRPKGLALDRDLNLYAVDAGFENVQIFNRNGQLLMFFGGPYKRSGDMYLPSGITIDYDNLKYFEEYVDSEYRLKYIILVTNQYGPDKVNVYGAIEPK